MYAKKGANINAKNYKGNSLLHILSFSSCLNKVDLWSFLIKKGANINVKNDLNETPLHIAVNNGISSNALENLLNLGADVKARTHEGKNALHYLVMGWDDRNNNPNFQLLGNLLVKKGLDVNSQDYKGDTPLHEIARKYRKSQSAIKFLLNNGAKTDIENGNNKIPLELAISKKSVNLKFFSDLSRQD